MPATQFDEIKNWSQGIDTSAAPDQIPMGFAPRGRNTQLKSIGDQTALIGARRGALTMTPTPITGAPSIIGYQFKKASGTKYNLLVSDTGRFDKINTDGTTTVINATGFTAGSYIPKFEPANDLLFIVTSIDQKKFDGTVLSQLGITRPAAIGTVTAIAGGVNGMLGAYDIAITYYNANTGHESSRSDFVALTLAAAQKMNLVWAAPVDPQVTHVRLYLRKATLGPNVFRVVAGATPAPDGTTGGYPVATLAAVLDISDAVFNAFIVLAPTTTENEPPPAGAKFPTYHNQRLFLADGGNVYYSNILDGTSRVEAFNPQNVQPVAANDGDQITALFSMWGRLYVFKNFSLWEIDGTDPNSWNVRLVSTDHGTNAFRSIVAVEGVLFWWSGASGPVAMVNNGLPINIGKQYINATVAPESLNHTSFGTMCAGVDEANQNILWAVPEVTQTRNTYIIPYNYRAKRFAAEFWTPFDVNSMWTVEDAEKLRSLYVGGYAGQAFKWWGAGNDGVPVGTTTHGTVSSSTATTLTDTTAAFANTGGKLVERYVYAISSDRQTVQRRRITSNTATVLTVSLAWDSNPNSTWTYVVGGIDFQLDTQWILGALSFYKKKYEFLFLEIGSTDLSVFVDIDIFMSMDDSAPRKTLRLALLGAGGVYDTEPASLSLAGVYDSTTYGASTVTFGKLRMALTGKAWKARIRNLAADNDLTVYKIAMKSVLLGSNR